MQRGGGGQRRVEEEREVAAPPGELGEPEAHQRTVQAQARAALAHRAHVRRQHARQQRHCEPGDNDNNDERRSRHSDKETRMRMKTRTRSSPTSDTRLPHNLTLRTSRSVHRNLEEYSHAVRSIQSN